ncbi:MAG: endonuclease Q family protein [Deltaproteobacteria bacterium]|nr:endonuclease Q family protein [Deltaproteobacteria bacterium]
MKIIADLHIHSSYSRATSREMNLPELARWAELKGINLLGTGDFTHPAHFASIVKLLEPNGAGLFTLRGSKSPVHFMLTAEVSNIFSQGGKTRKIHSLIFAPSIEAARKINAALGEMGNVESDGRPIFGFSAEELVKVVLDCSPEAMLVPAHAWTPWFSLFGSNSGFDTIEECFGDYAKHIHAIETGLSSDPAMNWRLSALDGITLLSNSDAHSPSKLGREANVLNSCLDYREITGIIRTKDAKKFLYTIEFFPEEGKYHSDGHRGCGVLFTPGETIKAGRKCPVCGKGLTVGVMSRVEELADRPAGVVPAGAVPAVSMIPLQEIIAESFGVGAGSVKVKKEYSKLVAEAGSEFHILLDMSEPDLVEAAGPRTAEAVMKVRRREVSITPGFDGEFGKIKIFGDVEKVAPKGPQQLGLL